MPSMRDAIREWKLLLSRKQDLSPVRFALAGDGSSATTADVLDRVGWAWVRYDEEQNKVSQVRNRKIPGMPQDLPIIIGKEFPTDRYMQVLGINWPLYDMFVTYPGLISYIVPPHGDSHHAYGSDPAYIDVRNILNGRVRSSTVESLSVQIDSFAYEYKDTRELFGGGAVDLESYIPGTADWHRYVLLAMDTIERKIKVVPGTEGPMAMPASLPDVSIWLIPLGVALLYEGITEITEQDIWDMRIAFNPTGGYNTYLNLVQHDYSNEMMWARHLAGEI